MNKEQYIYANGQILVETDKEKKMFPHFEGFDKILSQQNLVEKIQEKIKSYRVRKQDLKKKKLETLLKMLFVCGIYTLGGVFAFSMNASWLQILYALLAIISTCYYIDTFVDIKKKINAIDYSSIYLEEELVEAQNTLDELNQKEKLYTEPKQDFYLGNIPSNEKKIKFMNSCENLYYDCGYNYKKYILWYKLGLLREKLNQNYTEYGLDKIERCIATDAFQEKEGIVRKLALKTKKKTKK